MTESTIAEYWQSVRDIVAECKAQYPEPDDDERSDFIHQRVDDSSWVIYYGDNEVALDATNNEPDAIDVRGMCKEDADWRDMRQITVFLAMEADVYEALQELDEAA